ncbi:MAG TPA: hypothetical protein VE779_08185 [Candidatus Angelobacter sp.]|nr:hypothetical protein [Candidatus Angelobacter sp.]
MATNPQRTASERVGPALVRPGSRSKRRKPGSLKGRLLSTAIALAVLALVLRYLPPRAGNAQAQTKPAATVADSPGNNGR